jgi:iron complex outermembrane receptor protein
VNIGKSISLKSLLLSGAAALHASNAAADTVGGSGTASRQPPVEVETVTVTAQKRSEKLQEIPAAASVVTASDIENAGVNNIQDVAALTPNLVIIDQLRPGIQTVSFRGFTTVQGGQSPFAIVVDGVAEPGQEFLKQQLIDVQQIEVLRGPQGTLYGAGAVAGAINIVTKQPTDEFEASAKVGYAQGNQSTGLVTVSGPIVADKVFFRASAYSETFDGLIPNPAGKKHADFVDERAFTGELLFKPTEQLDIDFRSHVTNGTDGALWLVLVNNSQFDNFSKGPDEDIDGIDRRHLKTFSTKIDYRLEGVTLTSITAYNDAKQYATADGDFTAQPIYAQTWQNDTNAWSEEVRATSSDTGPLKWNLGAFGQEYRVVDATTFYSVNPASPFLAATDNHYHDRSWAVFGQASYDLTSRWTATAGARYDRVKADVNDFVNNVQDSHTFSATQPKATIEYKWMPGVLTYLTYGKGFRTGGFNPATPLSLRLYQNEVSTNYEGGIKTTLLDNRLLFNVAVFHTQFDNQQFFFSQATDQGIYRAIINIPKTRVNGGELEAQAKPISWLKLMASLGYNNTSIREFSDSSYNGKRTPQVYGFTGNLSVEATQPIADRLQLTARIDYDHRGDVFWDLENTLRTPAKNFVNARLAFERMDSAWSVAFYSHNLTNERTPAAVGANAFGQGLTLRSANEPRQSGVELQVRF